MKQGPPIFGRSKPWAYWDFFKYYVYFVKYGNKKKVGVKHGIKKKVVKRKMFETL